MPRKYLILIAATVMQACLGGIYAWSEFARALQQRFGYSAAQTQWVFGTCICVFTASVLFTGPLQDRRGPRLAGLVSGLLMAGSYLTAATFGGQYIGLWIGIGLIGGLGIGFGYVCPIATAVKWFPKHAGLVCGLAVAGYGAGAILLSNIVHAMLAAGADVLTIFRWVGFIYGAAILLAGLVLTLPEHHRLAEPLVFSRRTLWHDRKFWALVVGIFCAGLPGLMVIGNLKPIGLSLGNTDAAATLAISALAMGNASGRIAWGFFYHRFGSAALTASFVAIAAAVLLLPLVGAWGSAGFLVAAATVGFCYGGLFGLYPARIARVYDVRAMGAVYSLILLSHGISAQIGAPLGGLAFDLTHSYVPAILAAGLLPLLGLAIYKVMTKPSA
jgi:OFA family oxalate/formate antiporter-like MFS transporter